MARFNKQQVLAKITETGVVPVFYNSDVEVAKNIVKACYEGGIRAFEFTNRGDFAHEAFAEVVKFAASECPDMAMGVDPGGGRLTTEKNIQLGACFVVGPLFNPDVAKVCNRRLIPYTPGCGSVTEVGMAQEVGCDLCKMFPGDVLGPKFVKGLKAPMPWSLIMVTGGVSPDEENIASWIAAGATCVGMGSKLFPKSVIARGDWKAVSDKCRESLGYVAKARQKV